MTEPAQSPAAARQRLALDSGSWVDVWRGWLTDDGATYRQLVRELAWHESRLWRYDHYVTEPRLTASVHKNEFQAHPVLREATHLLREVYRVDFDGPSLAFYRDGRDALGSHRDRELRYTSNTLVAILTLGARRPWQLTPRRTGTSHPPMRGRMRPEPTVDLQPGDGDLFVLGGRAQADWLHGVPPVAGLTSGRISVQWRWTSRTGPPERGPGYRAPRHYSP